MPTDLPPDYKPQPANDPGSPPHPSDPGAVAPAGGADVLDPSGRPNTGPRSGVPGTDGDVVDPTGLPGPAGDSPMGVPSPAGMPTF